MRSTVAIAGLLCCGWGTGVGLAQPADTLVLTLARAEELALKNNPLIREAVANLELARAKEMRASHARYLPSFTLTNVWGPIPRARGEFTETGVLISPDTSTGLGDLTYFTEVDVDILQPLFSFGKFRSLIDAAEAGVEASRADVEAKEIEVRLQVRKLYWGLVLAEELLRVTEDIRDQVAEAKAKLEEKYDEGEVTQNDLFKFQIFEFEIGRRHREALDGVEMGRAALRAAVGLEEGRPFRLDTEALEPVDVTVDSLPVYLAMALEGRPEIRQLQAGIEAQSSLVRARRSDYWPQLFVGAQIKWNRAPGRFDPNNPFVYNPTNFFRPGGVIGFKWNLNFVQTRDAIRIARHDAAKMRQRLDPLSEKIALDVRKAYLDLKRAEADVEESARALKASDNWLRAESQTFDLGLSEIKDVIEAFQANVRMRTEHLQSIFAFNSAVAELSRAVGRDLYPERRGSGAKSRGQR